MANKDEEALKRAMAMVKPETRDALTAQYPQFGSGTIQSPPIEPGPLPAGPMGATADPDVQPAPPAAKHAPTAEDMAKFNQLADRAAPAVIKFGSGGGEPESPAHGEKPGEHAPDQSADQAKAMELAQQLQQNAAPKIGQGITGQSFQTTTIPKAEQAALTKANDEAVKAQQVATEQAAKVAEAQHSADVVEQNRLALAQQKAQQDNQRRQDIQQAQLDKSQTAIDDVKSAKVDPNKFWKDKGVGGHIAGAISIALGELGSKLSGGPNTALGIIDRAVDQNIEAQKEEARNAKDVASLQHNQFAQFLQQGMSEQQAESTMRAIGNEQAQQAMKAQLGKDAPATAVANGKVVEAALAQRNAQHLADIKKSVVQTTTGPTINGVPVSMLGKMGGAGAANTPTQAGLDSLEAVKAQFSGANAPGGGAVIAKHIPGTDSSEYEAARKQHLTPIAQAIFGKKYRPGKSEEIAERLVPTAERNKKHGMQDFDRLRGIIQASGASQLGGGGGGGVEDGAE